MKAPRIMIPVLGDDLEMTTRECSFVARDGELYCSDIDAVDYYGEFRGGYPWIAPELVEWAEKKGLYWEWENPGCIVLVE